MIQVPNVAALKTLTLLFANWDPWVHLYVNDVPLDLDTILSDFTEASYPGYSPQHTTGWTTPAIVARRALTSASPLVFMRDGSSDPQDCWGYYVTDGVDGDLIWDERFERPPIMMRTPTDTIRIVPVYTYRGERRRLRTGL